MVDLRTGETVALEALARGPAESPFASPLALFEAARRVGRVGELDWVCRAAAFAAFGSAGLPPAMSLFVNTEPEGVSADCPSDLLPVIARAESALRVFVEINDEAIAADPAAVLAAVDRAREMRWGVSVDDVGASRVTSAMLPILQPDLVKLDLRLLRGAEPEAAAATITSVLRHVESTGASLLIERIESEADARWARALGAAYGQGRHLGPPGPLADRYPAPRTPVPLVTAQSTDLDITSPFAPFTGRVHRRVPRDLVDQLGAVLARGPRTAETWPVFLVGLDHEDRPAQQVLDLLLGPPRRALLTVAFGTRMPASPAPEVRGVRLGRTDPMAGERFLVVLTDQLAAALLARRAEDGQYDVVVTQDQELVNGVTHHLIRRIPAPGGDHGALPLTPRPSPRPGTDPAAPRTKPRPAGWWRRLGLS